jgi:hypothetical protein
VTFAHLLVEIRREAARLGATEQRMALEEAVKYIVTEHQFPNPARRILAALSGFQEETRFDPGVLFELTPEQILCLDVAISEVVDHGRENDVLQAIRAANVRSLR